MQAYTHTHKIIINLYKKKTNKEDMKWEGAMGQDLGGVGTGRGSEYNQI